MDYRLTGKEHFTLDGKNTEMDIIDFWRWHFCERFDLQEKFAEYIVAKALGLSKADNVGVWTLFDILYRNTRIEIKETSYMHAWQTDEEKKSDARTFGITKAYSRYKDKESKYERQNDIYVFCLNTGKTRAESDPLVLEHWEFYIVPTDIINEKCGDAKSVNLSRLRKLAEPVGYGDIKSRIDSIIDGK